VYHPLENHN